MITYQPGTETPGTETLNVEYEIELETQGVPGTFVGVGAVGPSAIGILGDSDFMVTLGARDEYPPMHFDNANAFLFRLNDAPERKIPITDENTPSDCVEMVALTMRWAWLDWEKQLTYNTLQRHRHRQARAQGDAEKAPD
ncbi:MAG TPA: hypothetical protein VKD22_13280 [Ramlibacter sp.]|nr:hypothetical protein [Ramlibacter sp.]